MLKVPLLIFDLTHPVLKCCDLNVKSNVVWIPYSNAETEISFLYVFDLLFIVDSVSFHSS